MIESQLQNHEGDRGPKTINGLAINAYIKETGSDTITNSGIDNEFLDVTIENLKIFLFAGHDTTASTLCFAYNYLDQHPHVMEKLWKEHDVVLGPDPTSATSKISDTPTILNQLVYTTAIIKETLRLEPPIGSCREGSPTFFLRHPETGQELPTDVLLAMPDVWRSEWDDLQERLKQELAERGGQMKYIVCWGQKPAQ